MSTCDAEPKRCTCVPCLAISNRPLLHLSTCDTDVIHLLTSSPPRPLTPAGQQESSQHVIVGLMQADTMVIDHRVANGLIQLLKIALQGAMVLSCDHGRIGQHRRTSLQVQKSHGAIKREIQFVLFQQVEQATSCLRKRRC